MSRAVLVLLVLASLWTWHVLDRRREPPAVSAAATAPAAPDARAVRGEREEADAAPLWARLRGAPEPPPDPVVRCEVGEDSAFLRLSHCERRGGTVDEPDWARLD